MKNKKRKTGEEIKEHKKKAKQSKVSIFILHLSLLLLAHVETEPHL